jgi:ABC-type nickel/cobalt efflux system permease component RcnA
MDTLWDSMIRNWMTTAAWVTAITSLILIGICGMSSLCRESSSLRRAARKRKHNRFQRTHLHSPTRRA